MTKGYSGMLLGMKYICYIMFAVYYFYVSSREDKLQLEVYQDYQKNLKYETIL